MASARFFVDRTREQQLFQRMLAGQLEQRVLAIVAEGEKGKSYLLWHLKDTCREEGTLVALLDFLPERGGLTTYLQAARRLCSELGQEQFPTFQHQLSEHLEPAAVRVQTGDGTGGVRFGDRGRYERAQVNDVTGRDRVSIGDTTIHESEALARQRQEALKETLGIALRQDLIDLCARGQRVAILIDQFERAPQETREWIAGWLLRPLVEAYPGLVMVLAGRPAEPVMAVVEGSHPWRELVLPVRRLSAFSRDDVRRYFEGREIEAGDEILDLLHPYCKENPGRLSKIAEAHILEGRHD